MKKPEQATRKALIDPAIERAGWRLDDLSQVDIELPVDGHDAAPWNGVTDYVLFRENGEILAIIEAKKASFEPRLAQQQLAHYLTEIAKRQSFEPFGFLSNGVNMHFWDRQSGDPRPVRGFFSRDDLKRMLELRTTRRELTAGQINTSIINRPYQIEAIKRLAYAFEIEKRRKTLLVMATGTGKTRTAMALIDLFSRSNQARNILFVADRDALVEQALGDGFERHIPSEPCVRIRSTNIAEVRSARLFAVTLQTLSNVFDQFTPGFFDLIVFDEVHRSIFNKYDEVLDYFDARMVGLTATPADFLDRNTFLKFDCFDQIPTFLYTYDQAIAERYLVDFRLYKAETRFQREGIRGYRLGEDERNLLIEQGFDPDDIDFAGTQLEKDVTNRDTLRRQWEEIISVCHRDQSGQYPAKTIVFAMTQEHAVRLQRAFEEMYPQWAGMSQVITSKSEYRGQALEAFKKQSFPRIAISVDMLETGVDVPEVVNLVFMRPVESRIKMQQMIGRGTRSNEACTHPEWLPSGQKTEFLIIDFWENDFARQAGNAPSAALPVMVSLFNTRLRLLESIRDQSSDDWQRVVSMLRRQIELIPLNSYSVSRVVQQPGVQDAWHDNFWRFLTPAKFNLLRTMVGPLLRYAADVDVAGTTFVHKVERLKLQKLEGKPTTNLAAEIAEDVSRLPDFVMNNAPYQSVINLVLSGGLEKASMDDLDQIIDVLADQMRHKRATVNTMIELDLRDFIASGGFIVVDRTGEKVYVEEYRRRIEQRVTELADTHPTLQAVRQGNVVDDTQLVALERTLRHELAGEPLELTPLNLRRAYGSQVISFLGLLRELLELDPTVLPDYQDVVERGFDRFILEHESGYNADQLRFIRAIKATFMTKQRLERADLYEAPFTNFGQDAVERLFSPAQVDEILALAAALAA